MNPAPALSLLSDEDLAGVMQCMSCGAPAQQVGAAVADMKFQSAGLRSGLRARARRQAAKADEVTFPGWILPPAAGVATPAIEQEAAPYQGMYSMNPALYQ